MSDDFILDIWDKYNENIFSGYHKDVYTIKKTIRKRETTHPLVNYQNPEFCDRLKQGWQFAFSW